MIIVHQMDSNHTAYTVSKLHTLSSVPIILVKIFAQIITKIYVLLLHVKQAMIKNVANHLPKHNNMSDKNSDILPPDFYTPLADAVVELERRRKSPTLLQIVRENLKLTQELEVIFEKPHLVMFRQILSPVTETVVFFELAKKYNLAPLVIEYFEDKFVSTGNTFKRGLGKLPIHQFTDKNNFDVIKYNTVVDFNSHVGHTLGSVVTHTGESLKEFHHDLFFKTLDIKPIVISRDGSSWFKQFISSHEYYESFLDIFIRDAILFETFYDHGSSSEFTFETVLPAFTASKEKFDHKPLIVRATYDNDTIDYPILDYYPTKVGEILTEKGYI